MLRWVNVKLKDFADIQTTDMLDLPTPEVKYDNIILEPSDLQKNGHQLTARAVMEQKTQPLIRIQTILVGI